MVSILTGISYHLLCSACFVLRAVGGDPLQLGPVAPNRSLLDPLVYQCRAFDESFQSRHGVLVRLTGSHRQTGSTWFSACLDRIRVGSATQQDVLVLNATSEGVSQTMWRSRTQLRALNRQVMAYNNDKLQQMEGADTVYKSYDVMNPSITHPRRRAYAESCVENLAPASVTLKPGAVVLTTRAVEGVPTATQGVVCQCRSASVVCMFGGRQVEVPFMAFDFVDNRNDRLASRFAIPLILAWAMTIHRAQGATLDTLAIDFSELSWREEGLVYTALSRCRSFEGLLVKGLRQDLITVSSEGKAFYGT